MVNLKTKNIGILCFDDVDPLDVYGPLEVFSQVPGWKIELIGIDCYGVSKIVSGTQVFNVRSFGEVPGYDLFVVPGGIGLTKVLENHLWLNTVKRICDNSADIASICAGALVLAAIGLLEGKMATTHWASKSILKEIVSSIKLKRKRCVRDVRKIGAGEDKTTYIYTSSGVSAGIDLALYYVHETKSVEKRRELEVLLEYKFDEQDFFDRVKSSSGYNLARRANEKMLSKIIITRKKAIKKYLASVRNNK